MEAVPLSVFFPGHESGPAECGDGGNTQQQQQKCPPSLRLPVLQNSLE